MRPRLVLLVAVAGLAAACAGPSAERQYPLQGQVISITPNRLEATIKHEAIKGLMPAMTMPYRVKDAKLLDSVAPGDLVNATLVVASNDAYLTVLKKVGQAPLERPPADVPAPSASAGSELLKPGEAVPDASFVDQDEKPRTFASFRGSTLVVTFTYTSCPLPTFCPLIDRQFATLQSRIRDDRSLNGRVHLVSVSFDPDVDTPAVLKDHARILQADPKAWTFLTGDRARIDPFAARFGVSVTRAPNDPRDITHNLRTAIVDPAGKVVKIYTGNEWTPEQVLADVR